MSQSAVCGSSKQRSSLELLDEVGISLRTSTVRSRGVEMQTVSCCCDAGDEDPASEQAPLIGRPKTSLRLQEASEVWASGKQESVL
jgi:hypothetical protein